MILKVFIRKAKNSPLRLRVMLRWHLQTIVRFHHYFLFLGLRLFLWRLRECKLGKNVSIGWAVYFDVGNAKLITVGDDVWIMSRVLLLCHRRDMYIYY